MDGKRQPGERQRSAMVFFALGAACFLLAGSLVLFFSGKFKGSPSGMMAGPSLSLSAGVPSPGKPAVERQAESPSGKSMEKQEWILYITGGVSSPGVYRLPPGSRVFNLVDAAGGLTPKADAVRINLAAPLSDGVHVHVPLLEEEVSGDRSGRSFLRSSPGILPPSSLPPGISRAGEEGAEKVDVNRASLAELQQLPGVGPSIAGAILAYREMNGFFSSVEELMKVKGIGPKKLEAMRGAVILR